MLLHVPAIAHGIGLSPKAAGCRNAEDFVGLRNGSATCYMNAVFQQLFMQPAVRARILSTPEVPRKEQKESVFYQLQVRWLRCRQGLQPVLV